MRTIKNLILLTLASLALVSCGAAKKAAKPGVVKTYEMPGTHLLGQPDVLRVLAVGVSDSEMTAKKKAMMAASSQMAQMLESVVTTTIENYCVSLQENEVLRSKQYFNEKTKVVSNQVLTGLVTIFDQWVPKDDEGMYRNYVVVELVGSEYIKRLLQAMEGAPVDVDEDLLNELFLKAVNESSAQNR